VTASLPSATDEYNLEQPSGKNCASAEFFFRDLDCAPKSVRTQKPSTYLARRLAIAGLQLAAVMRTRNRITRRYKRVKFTLFRCTSAKFFSCCDSNAVPRQRPGHHDQVPAKINERRRGHRPKHHNQVPATHNGCRRGQRPRHHAQLPARRRGQRLCATMKCLRRTTSAAAGSGLGTTTN
jgi:hypothetical protein